MINNYEKECIELAFRLKVKIDTLHMAKHSWSEEGLLRLRHELELIIGHSLPNWQAGRIIQ